MLQLSRSAFTPDSTSLFATRLRGVGSDRQKEMPLCTKAPAGGSELRVELSHCYGASFLWIRDADRLSLSRLQTRRLSLKSSYTIIAQASSALPVGSKSYLDGESGNGAALSHAERNHHAFGSATSAVDVALSGDELHIHCGAEEEKAFGFLHKGTLLENRRVYRQAFVIRSYEVCFDRMASIQTITNLFQEMALNHVGMMDFVGDGMGATHAMIENRLIWIITRLHAEVDTYPIWGDVVEIDSWVNACGKNGMKRDFLVRNYRNKHILARGTSNWAMMNQDTRKLSKMPDDVRAEISPFFLNRSVMGNSDCVGRLPALANDASYVKDGLLPKVQDLDMNEHVNHVKYIDWILECMPQSLLLSNELKSIVLEYRRECGPLDMVESILHMKPSDAHTSNQCTHMLRLQNCGTEVLRACTQWQPKALRGCHNS